jgi:hypothetical protein
MAAGDKARHRQRAIAALLTAPTIAEAAKVAGVSVSTLMRWQRQPEFKAEIESVKRQYLASAVGELQASATLAVRTLRRVLQLPHSSNLELIAASRAILDYCERYSVADSLNERITKLEQQKAGIYAEPQEFGETGWESRTGSGPGRSASFADQNASGRSGNSEQEPDANVRVDSGDTATIEGSWSSAWMRSVPGTSQSHDATPDVPVLDASKTGIVIR